MSALLLILLCTAELILFLLPGFALLTLIARRLQLSSIPSLIATISFSATFGYVAFWIYFADKSAGQAFSYGVAAASIIVLVALKRNRPSLLLQRDFIVPLAYSLCLSLFYLSLLYVFVNPLKAGVDVANVRFFPETRPGDNIIPFIFAQRIYDRAPIRPFCCGDWLSSDRPPLQAGIFLLQRPLRAAGNTGLQYQVLGTLLQCLFVCGVWCLLRTLGTSWQRSMQTLGLLAFSGFLFYNSVYVWPKLLAATFILFVFAILARAVIDRRALMRIETVLAALCFTLALLAHPGSVFSAPAIFVLLFVRRNLLSVKQAAMALLILISFVVPWTLYQKFYDPPGDRLLKMHLAGVMEPDSRNSLQALRDAYGRLSPAEIVEYKWKNLETLVGEAPWRRLRVAEREYVLSAIGLLNFGWIAWMVSRPKARYSGTMAGAAALNLVVWCVVMFGPGQTVTEHGSYADILLLCISASMFLLTASRMLSTLVLALQAANLIFVWVSFRPASFTLPSKAVVAPSLQWPMLILGIAIGAGLFWQFLTATFADAFLKKKPQ